VSRETAAWRSVAAGVAAGAALTACGERPPAARPDVAAAEAAQAGYVAPPRVERVESARTGLVVQGTSHPGARIRITDAAGAYGGTADAQGRWRVDAPAAPGPRLFTLSAERDARVLEAEGRLLVLPDAPALLLRPGHGALPVASTPAGRPRILSIDVAADGAAAVSGVGPPSAPAVTRIDGVAPGDGTAVGSGATDAAGRFSIILARPLGPGSHLIEVNTPSGLARAQVGVSPADPGTLPFVATRDASGWRVAWRAPGSAVQTTYVLAPSAAS
jgi:hypothetical protein